MFLINDIPILIPVQAIINELNLQLRLNNRPYLDNIKIMNGQLLCSCPFHTDRKPSFSILLNNKGDKQAGLWHCFSCGRSGNLSKLVANLLFDKESKIFGEEWLIENFADYDIDNRETALKKPNREQIVGKKEYISDNELNKYLYYHPYFEKRHLTEDIIVEYNIGYDKDTNSMTMPVYNQYGQVEFIVRRNVDIKRFDMPKGIDKILYGVFQMKRLFPNTNYCYITESIMNCLTLVGHFNVPAIALLGTGSSQQYKLLRELNIRKYIIALDNDNAGQVGTFKLYNALKDSKIIYRLETPTNGLDINDCWNDKKLLDKVIPM